MFAEGKACAYCSSDISVNAWRASLGSENSFSYEISEISRRNNAWLGTRLSLGLVCLFMLSFGGSRLESISPKICSRLSSTFGCNLVSFVSLSEFLNCNVRRTLLLISRVASSMRRTGCNAVWIALFAISGNSLFSSHEGPRSLRL